MCGHFCAERKDNLWYTKYSTGIFSAYIYVNII